MKRLELLDYGRFFATLGVMFFHYFFNGIQNGKISTIEHIPGWMDVAKYGYLGVEFFFMISGYVIFFSSKGKTAGEFGAARALRLFPAYWVAVLFTSAVAFFWGGSLMSVGFYQALCNLTMLPGLFGQGYVDGVYWTLQYELSFYALILLILLLRLQGLLENLFVAWPFVLLLAWCFNYSHVLYLGEYYCYFAAGSVLAVFKYRKSWLVALSVLISCLVCIEFSAGESVQLSLAKGVAYSAWVIGCIVIAQFIFFLVLISKWGGELSLPGSKLAGGLTYPVYLIHAHLGYMILSKFGTNESRWVSYAFAFAVVLCVAFFLHAFVEKKLSRYWKKLFDFLVAAPLDRCSKLLAVLMIRKAT